MPQDAVQMGRDSAVQVADERDLHNIVDLIEQLDHDLAETRKNDSKRR